MCGLGLVSVERGEFGAGSVEADTEAFLLAEPAVKFGLLDPLGQIGDDLDRSWALAGIDPQHRAADAAVLMSARRIVGAPAGAERNLPQREVV